MPYFISKPDSLKDLHHLQVADIEAVENRLLESEQNLYGLKAVVGKPLNKRPWMTLRISVDQLFMLMGEHDTAINKLIAGANIKNSSLTTLKDGIIALNQVPLCLC